MFAEKYNESEFIKFLEKLVPSILIEQNQVKFDSKKLSNIRKIGIVPDFELIVLHVCHSFSDNARVRITNEGLNLLRSLGFQKGLIVFNSEHDDNWRLSLLTTTPIIKNKKIINKFSNPRRYSYLMGPKSKVATPQKYLIQNGPVDSFKELESRFEVEVVNKEFYDEISSVFHDFINQSYIENLKSDSSEIKRFAVRLIERVLFCYFLKVKKSIQNTQMLNDNFFSETYIKPPINIRNF